MLPERFCVSGMEEDKSSKVKHPPSLPVNYVTIVDLQERWIKERQRKEKEKEGQEQRLHEDKQRWEKDLTLHNQTEASRRGRERVKEGLGQNRGGEEFLGKGRRPSRKPRVEAEDCAPARVRPKTGYRDLGPQVAEIEGKLESLSVKGEISAGSKGIGRNGGSRVNVALQYVPKPKILSVAVNEESSLGTKPCRYGRNRMKRNVDIDGNADKVSGSSTTNNGGKRMHRNVDIHGKLEKLSMSGARGGCNIDRNESSGMARNVDVNSKLDKDSMSGARGGQDTNRNESIRMDRIGDVDGKLDKVLLSNAKGGSKSSRNEDESSRMDKNVDVDGNLDKVRLSGARGRSKTSWNENDSKSTDKNVDADGNFDKVQVSGARGGSNAIKNENNWMDGTGSIDGKLEKVPMSSARVGSNTCNGADRVNKIVHTDWKLKQVLVRGAQGGKRSRPRAAERGFERGGYHDKTGMVWVKKGAISDCNCNTGGIQN